MPRVGIRCPVDGEEVSDEACLACCVGTPRPASGTKCGFPREVLLHMMDSGGRETAGVSATMLGGCRRQTWLEAREPFCVDPEKGWAALRGSIGHAILESHREPGAIVEVRFEAETPWGPVTGQIDKVHPGRGTVTDFKTKADDKKPVVRAQPDHVLQLNVYRWLLWHGWPQEEVLLWDPATREHRVFQPGEPARIGVDRLELVYWTFGWVRTVEVPLLDEDQVRDHVHSGIRDFRGGRPPEVPADRDPVGKGRKGPHPLCKDWCAVRSHCLAYLLEEGG